MKYRESMDYLGQVQNSPSAFARDIYMSGDRRSADLDPMDLASSGFDLARLQPCPSSFCASFIDIDWPTGSINIYSCWV